jgi:polyhydroxybutyrate depolymerase
VKKHCWLFKLVRTLGTSALGLTLAASAAVAQGVAASVLPGDNFASDGIKTSAAGVTTMTWDVNGVTRTALVFAPRLGVHGEKLPLVFAFHRHGDTMEGAAQKMHLQSFWPDAIVVYPQGLKTPRPIDPQGLHSGWQTEAGQAGLGDRDLKFFDAMLADLRQKFPVDDARIYATGDSNGGWFSYLLWAEKGQVLAALGICAGALAPSEHLTLPRAVVVIAGKADQELPFADQQQSIQAARQVDNATGPGQPCGPVCTLYPSTSHTPVETRIHPGGHIYPPWAASAFVEFFKNHKL